MPKDIAEIATSLRQIHDEVVAIGTEDHERLGRIEEKVAAMDRKLTALCRAIGGPAKAALEAENE